MPEGGKGAVSVNVDFKDVWSAVHDVADWIGSENDTQPREQCVRDPQGHAVAQRAHGLGR